MQMAARMAFVHFVFASSPLLPKNASRLAPDGGSSVSRLTHGVSLWITAICGSQAFPS
jgi:hypothetical protein